MSDKQAVLIVDDRRENLVALRHVLADLDVEIVEATSGNDALAATIGRHFALAIVDVQMPGMGGYELAENLRGDEATRVIPIIFVTASFADDMHMFQGYEAGGVDYIVKPFDSKVLLGKVRVFLELDWQRQELSRHRDELQGLVAERTAQLRHLGDVLRGIRNVNQLIVREGDRRRLIEDGCRTLVTQRGYQGAWILLEAGANHECFGSQAGFPEEVFGELLEHARQGEWPPCCSGSTVAEVNMITCPAETCAGCPMAHVYGDCSAMSAPLVHDGRRYGCLGVSVPARFAADREEQSLFMEIAADIGFALHGIEAEEEHVAKGERYRALVMQSMDCLILHDLDGNIQDVNERSCVTYGYSREELLSMNVGDLDPDYESRAETGAFYRRMEPGGTVEFEARQRSKDGRVFPVEVRLCLMEIAGEPLVQGLCRDITEKHVAHRKLMESEDRYKRLVEMLTEGIWAIDEQGRTTFVNPAMAAMLGHDVAEMEGRKLFDFMEEDAVAEMERHLAARRQGVAERYEFTFRSKEGEPVHVLLSTRPIRGEDGVHRGSLASVVDLSEIRRVEAERSAMEAQLRQAQKLESVGRLAGGVAHDFNNLVMGVMGYAELCSEELGPDHPAGEWLQEIKREAKRTSNLTHQLLAFARKQTVAPQVLDLNDTVADMLKMLGRLIGEDIKLSWSPGADVSTIKMDPGQVDQILANLCVNARDAIGGVGRIEIETSGATLDEDYCAMYSEADPGEFVVLSVSDNGSGMDAETRANIFEPFFTTKPQGKGTGLGLATVYGIVKQNRGVINVYSEPGEGTTFRIYLPRHNDEAEGAAGRSERVEVRGGSETVLLVEDEDSIRRTMGLFLSKAGYTVLSAAGPVEALETAGKHEARIDLLLTDVVMPEMNGRQLTEKLTAQRKELRVLYMSGYTANVIAHRGVLEEGVEFLSKPVSREDLLIKVRGLLDMDG